MVSTTLFFGLLMGWMILCAFVFLVATPTLNNQVHNHHHPAISSPQATVEEVKLAPQINPPAPEKAMIRSEDDPDNDNDIMHLPHGQAKVRNLSLRNPNVIITADVRGNLGPPSVLNQFGTNWLTDRWQAASNMHGTAIPGRHWISMDLGRPCKVHRLVLDWESAYSNDYRIYASPDAPIQPNHLLKSWMMFDGTNSTQAQHCRSVQEYGQSPGVKFPMPLHVVHNIFLSPPIMNARFIFLDILRPGKHGWGVSLWQVDIFGMDQE